MGDGIGFQETGPGLIPLIGPDGDLLLEDGSGLGRGQPQFMALASHRGHQPVNGGGRDG